MLVLAFLYKTSGESSLHYTLYHVGKTELFGFTFDAVSTLIAIAVVVLGFLVSIYSLGYMNEGNREHPHEGEPRYYALFTDFYRCDGGLSTVINDYRSIIVFLKSLEHALGH